jgi:hypothetical protein
MKIGRTRQTGCSKPSDYKFASMQVLIASPPAPLCAVAEPAYQRCFTEADRSALVVALAAGKTRKH